MKLDSVTAMLDELTKQKLKEITAKASKIAKNV
jgi:hypothetical protein